MYRTPVCCTAYTSPADLWLQLRWDGGRELKGLMLRATNWATAAAATAARGRGDGASPAVRENDWVLARPSGQPLWFRASVVKAAAPEQRQAVAVRLVDFGDRLDVPSTCLAPMPAVFLEPLGFAVRCKLARLGDPPGGRWSQAEATLLERLVTMATEDLILEAEIDWQSYANEEEPLSVELYQCSGQSINDIFGQRTGRLIKHRPVASGFINSWCPRLQTPAASAVVEKRSPEVEAPPKLSWEPLEGRISHVTDKGVVFVQEDEKLLGGLQCQLELFHGSDDLHRFSARSLPEKDEIMAVFQQDAQQQPYHYRGRMLENLGDRARLLIVDFGFELTVRWDQCARIPTRIRYKPQCRPFEPTGLERLPEGTTLKSLWELLPGPAAKSVKASVTPIEEASGPEVQAADIALHQPEGRDPINLVDFLLQRNASKVAADATAKDGAPKSYRPCQAEIKWDVDNIVCATCTHVEPAAEGAPAATTAVAYFQPDSMQDTAKRVQTLLAELPAGSLQPVGRDADCTGASLPVLVEVATASGLMRGALDRRDEAAQTCDLTCVDTGARALGVSMAKVYAAPPDIASLPTTCVKCVLLPARSTDGDSPGGNVSVKAGDLIIFTIAGIADGAYQVSIVRSG